jgi:ribose 1,5-bisphosphokinase PhnN
MLIATPAANRLLERQGRENRGKIHSCGQHNSTTQQLNNSTTQQLNNSTTQQLNNRTRLT